MTCFRGPLQKMAKYFLKFYIWCNYNALWSSNMKVQFVAEEMFTASISHFPTIAPCVWCLHRVAVRHVKVKPRCAVLTMLKRLDKIRFRGPRTRDDFPDLAESPPASDNECSDDMQLKPRAALRDTEDLVRDPVSAHQAYICVCVCVCVWAGLLPYGHICS